MNYFLLRLLMVMPTQSISRHEIFDAFSDDLLAERAHRPLIIVGSSKVDLLLLGILEAHLLPKIAKPKDPDELLQGDRPLATFSARIKMCYRLGLIDQNLYLILDTLRSLRNPSAHEVAFDIGRSPAREHLATIRNRIVGLRPYVLTKERYFGSSVALNGIEEMQCILLTICVLLEVIREKTVRLRASRLTFGNSKPSKE